MNKAKEKSLDKKGGTTRKKGKKGAKKKQEEQREATEQQQLQEDITVLDKQYYITQIQSLERNLERTNFRCEQLTSAENHAREEYKRLRQEKTDIIQFLRTKLKEKENQNEELTIRLKGLNQATEDEKKRWMESEKDLTTKLEKTKAHLSDEILSVTRKLDSLEEFRIERENIHKEYQSLQRQLENEREEHMEKLISLERDAMEAKARLVKEQEDKIAILTVELRENAMKDISLTTQAALKESSAQNKAIISMKNHITSLTLENTELLHLLEDVKSERSVLETSLRKMTSVAVKRATVLREVASKAADYSNVLKERECLKTEKENLKRTLQQTQFQLDTTTKLSCDVKESSSEKTIAMELLQAKLSEERQERMRLNEVLNSALQLLERGLFETPVDSLEATGYDDDPFEFMKSVFKSLVEILSRSTTEPTTTTGGGATSFETTGVTAEFQAEKDGLKTHSLRGESPPSSSMVTRDNRVKPLAKYNKGDLGFIATKSSNKK